MRALVACALLAGCHHPTARAPSVAPRITAAEPPHEPAPLPDPEIASLTFLERVSPKTIEVAHATVDVLRRAGPESVDAQLSDLSEHMRACYLEPRLFPSTTHDYMTMTIDA